MAKQCQIIAVVNGKKTKAQKALTAIHHRHQASQMLDGFTRTYVPTDDEGEKLPSETKKVQVVVEQDLSEVASVFTELWDAVATQDFGNCDAKADVVVDGQILAKQVPVTHLLFLEKQMEDFHTIITKLPILDPSEDWKYDENKGHYKTGEVETRRTKKEPRVIVKYEATDKHPAQTDLLMEDKSVGTWKTVKFSGAIPADKKQALLERVIKVQEAIKFAREEANSVEVKDRAIGGEICKFILG